MVRIKNDVIDARNNYALGNPSSKYGKYILGDNGKSEELVTGINVNISSSIGATGTDITVTKSTFGTDTVPE